MSRRTARALAAGLVAYGIAGLALTAAIALAVAPALATAESLSRSSGEVAGALAMTRDAFERFGVSLVEARLSAQRAAATARSTAATSRRLADAMGISILGARPLLPIADGFTQQAKDLEALATETDRLAAALQDDERDVGALRDQMSVLRDRVASIGATAPSAVPVAPMVYALLAWLAVQAVAALWVGAALLRQEA